MSLSLKFWLALWFAVLVWFVSNIAMAYPENVRLGYTGCGSCHVSPTGGGALTNYGRTTAEELSSFAPEGSGRLFGTLSTPDAVAVGGDARYVRVKAGEYQRQFAMQNDFELALHLSPEVWVDAALGIYGPERAREVRRNYVFWSPSENYSVRVGKFFPAYGIMMPDHTLATRGGLGFGEGQETYNAELSVHSKAGDITLTPTWGVDEHVRGAEADGYRFSTGDTGATARATAYIGDSSTVGVSGRYQRLSGALDTMTYGAFGTAGMTRDTYAMCEVDYQANSDQARKLVSYTEIGSEVVRGVHPQLTHEATFNYAAQPDHKLGVNLQLLPFVHWEFLSKSQYDVLSKSWAYTLLAHYYW